MSRFRIPGFLVPFLVCSLILIVPTFVYLSVNAPARPVNDARTAVSFNKLYEVGSELEGNVIMPKLPNATAKAELGRASWKLLHTMAQRYPESPNADEKAAFRSFVYLFSRLYPCGECAAHFQTLLRDYPPQTSSRKAAAMWLCVIHNQVNLSLDKEEFDCSQLEGLYDCGCGDEGKQGSDLSVDTEINKGQDPLTGEKLIQGRKG